MPNDMSPIQHEQAFTIISFLEGKTKAWGVFEDRFGKVKRRFDVEMNGSWSDVGVFILAEDFKYDDGRVEHRQWHIKSRDDGQHFKATCADCVGEALGHTKDNVITMRYRFKLQLKKRMLHVDFLDRIIKVDNMRAVNRATMSKWGVKLGELSLFFEKR